MAAKIFKFFKHLKRDHVARKTQAVARRARLGKPAKTFISQPMPQGIGSAQKGMQLAAGNFLIDGHVFKEPGEPIWDVDSDNVAFQKKANSFFWLDHLTANGSAECNSKARVWFTDWFTRFGDGRGVVWTPELAGMRVIRMVNHAITLLGDSAELPPEFYFSSISHHARFLRKRWRYTPEGLSRFQALAGHVYSALALEDFAHDLKPALRALIKECKSYIERDGSIQSRNPEELLDIFTLLVWVDQGMTTAALKPNRGLLNAIERIAPMIRTLRMGDGGLIEFHGGRMTSDQRIRRILSDSCARSTFTYSAAMGYACLSAARGVLVMDAGPVPVQDSTTVRCGCALAFEFSTGAQTVIRSVGSGYDFGEAMQKAGRVTSAYSVASIQPYSATQKQTGRRLSAALAPDTQVTLLRAETSVLEASHTGYRTAFGLMYLRRVELSDNGCAVSGTDVFLCENAEDQKAFNAEAKRHASGGVPYIVRFHLSPAVEAELDLGGAAISLQLPNNEVWIFKTSAGVLSLEDSAHFEADRLRPRATKQIVVTSQIVNYEGAISWVLAKLEG